MVPLLHRQPFKTIYLLGFLSTMVFIQLPYWLIYYSWRPNRPRKSWTLHRTISVRIVRNLTRLPFTAGLRTNRDLSLEVPQNELGPFNSRFVWIPELEEEDIVGMVGEYATRAGVKSISIPAYWLLKDGDKWSPEYDKARKDEKAILYLHGGAYVVRFFSSYHLLVLTFSYYRWGQHTRLTQRRLFPRDCSNILRLSPACCRSTTDLAPGPL